jgi:hypothetical protein
MRSTSPFSTGKLIFEGRGRAWPRRISVFFPRAPGEPPAKP